MKRVFSLAAYLSNMVDAERSAESLISGWPLKAEGKTEEECRKIGIYVDDCWMVEVEEDTRRFNIKAFCASVDEEDLINSLNLGWPMELHGKTIEETKEMGYYIPDHWTK